MIVLSCSTAQRAASPSSHVQVDAHVCARFHTRTANMRACRVRRGGLTVDDGGDLVPAGPVLVLDLADERGVDGVVHFLHHQLVPVHYYCVRQRPGGPGERRARGRGMKERRRKGRNKGGEEENMDI